jgi:hypothetical protein
MARTVPIRAVENGRLRIRSAKRTNRLRARRRLRRPAGRLDHPNVNIPAIRDGMLCGAFNFFNVG